MKTHLQREIEKLKEQIVLLGGAVEKNLEDAVRSIEIRDLDLARSVHDSDSQIDQREVDIEEECLKILALHQPVAVDLRFIVVVLKINNDLERIGDEAVNISGRSKVINTFPRPQPSFELSLLSQKVRSMLAKSLDALVKMDAGLAYEVRASDDEIDDLVHRQFQEIKKEIGLHPEKLNLLVECLRVFRHLERVADHATNIAEDVIYMVEGQIIRHRPEK